MHFGANHNHGLGDRRALRVIAGVAVVSLALAGCSSSAKTDRSVSRAESAVSDAKKALTDAKSNSADKNAAFCTSAKSYIGALDQYGDVLNRTAATVGDVKTAGAELAEPREDAISSAEAAVGAQEGIASAQQDLADAEAELKSVKSSAAGTPTTVKPSTPASLAPLAPSASVDRVKQADAEFKTAQAAITDQTPLTQASQQFNSAAVALEMSWLRLFNDTGCIADSQQQQAETAVRAYTTALQTALASAGYFEGEVDGVYGPSTVDAVQALQTAHHLPVTGTVDKATDAALQSDLQAKGGAVAQSAQASTAAVQQTLKLTGFWTGPVDGKWTPELTDALQAFQTELGVEPTGTVDAATIAAFEDALAAAQAEPSPSPSPSATATSPSASASPSAATS